MRRRYFITSASRALADASSELALGFAIAPTTAAVVDSEEAGRKEAGRDAVGRGSAADSGVAGMDATVAGMEAVVDSTSRTLRDVIRACFVTLLVFFDSPTPK
jgi:hypothetical protein